MKNRLRIQIREGTNCSEAIEAIARLANFDPVWSADISSINSSTVVIEIEVLSDNLDYMQRIQEELAGKYKTILITDVKIDGD